MKTNRKLITWALCLTIVLSLVPLVYGAIADSAKLQVTLISQEPDPAEPGGILDVRFKVENMGGGGTDNIIFEILPGYPFSLYTGSAAKSLGSMQAYQNGEEGIIVHYKLRVDESAVEGNNLIDIRYKFGELSSQWNYVRDFVLRVRTEDIVLLIDDISSIPEIIPPGQRAKLKLTIKNLADSLVKDIKIKLDISSDSIPFVPIRSTTEKKIYQIASKDETILIFDIMAMADADSQAYKVPLDISYYDEAGTSYEKSDIISLIVGDKPDMYIGVDSSEIYGGNKGGKVTVRFVNKGVTDIKFLNIRLKESEDYEIISPAEVYIGNVDSDDYETADYDLYVKTREDIVNLPLVVEYMDANNNKYSSVESLELRQYSSSEAKKYGLAKERGIGGAIMFLIVVGGLGIYIWRQKKKGKKIFGKW
ncbi:COG1361 S-layer family protein [Candidatus Woesearchaeota archaeon]|nr:COG1361 S-layer family protein [Candidatus Woesearchaeota archaeon]